MKIVVCGSFGFGNAGDEAVPLAVADLCNFLNRSVSISVVGRFWEPALPNVIGLSPKYRDQREALRNQPVFFIGGGIVDSTPDCVVNKCRQFLDSARHPLRVIWAANVEKNLKYGFWQRQKLRQLFKKIDALYVRDQYSELAATTILKQPSAPVVGDSVLFLKKGETPPEIAGVSKFIAVSLAPRWQKEPKWVDWIVPRLVAASRAMNCALIFIPLSHAFDSDTPHHLELEQRINKMDPSIQTMCLQRIVSPREIAATYACAALTICSRLHGCVMSYAQKAPCLAIAYHAKVMGFSCTIGRASHTIPHVLPDYQGNLSEGFPYTDLQREFELISIEDFAEACVRASEDRDFSKLEIFRQILCDSFVEALDLAAVEHSK